MTARTKIAAYTLLRVSLGINFLGHGLFRILSGVSIFAATTAEHMTKSPLPLGFIISFAYVIPWIELLLGLGLIVGLATRAALVLGAIFIMALTVGITSNQQWDVASQQLLYSLILTALLFGIDWNNWSLDALFRGKASPLQ